MRTSFNLEDTKLWATFDCPLMIWHPQWIKWSYRQDSVAAARGDSAKPKYQSANTIRLPGCSNCKTTMSTSQLTKGTSRSIAPLCFELLFASFWASRGNQLPAQGKRWEGKKKYLSVHQLLSKHRNREAECRTFCPERMD